MTEEDSETDLLKTKANKKHTIITVLSTYFYDHTILYSPSPPIDITEL